MILTDLQCDMLLAAAAKPDEVIHCDETLGERWSAQLGGKYFNGQYRWMSEPSASVAQGCDCCFNRPNSLHV